MTFYVNHLAEQGYLKWSGFSHFNAKTEQNTNVYHQFILFVASCFSALVELINNSPLQKGHPSIVFK